MIDTRLTRSKEVGEVIEVGGQKVALGIPGAGAAQAAAFARTLPLRRMGSAAEAAGAMLLLASPLAGYVTGQCLEVNGGSYM
jgi:3-oxoacyl-[acyl-carrier protein] reductase